MWGVFALCALISFPQISLATVETFTSAGASTWTAPADVYSVTVETWGGGGGSGGGTDALLPGGGGGGGGAYASKVISVTPGVSYNYTVGAAGIKSGGTKGGNSVFTGDASVQSLACGGDSGSDNSAVIAGASGTGGSATCSDGTTKWAGGNGDFGSGTSGGGGGEASGGSAAGNAAVGAAGGTGTAGTDGSAGQALGVAGVAGNNPGAGAGGSGRRSGGSEAGADGGVGQVKLTYTATPPVLSQTAYIFLNDNGTTTDTYTQSHAAATSTSISSVKKGEKLVARIQIDNTGPATSTKSYRLQFENNTDAAGTWIDLGTTTAIRWALSEKAAMPGHSGGVPLTSKQVGNCTTTTTFVSGFFVAGTATSSVLSLGPTKCTELAYAIETSGATLNKTYRLRLVTGSTTTALDAYTQYPTFTIESAQSIRYSKEARGGTGTTTDGFGIDDPANNVGLYNTSLAIGADGFPVISYYDFTAGALKLYKCNTVSCSSGTASTLDDPANDVGWFPSLAVGADGFPVISYYDFTAGALKLYKCDNVSCSSGTASTLEDVANNVGYYTSLAIGTDGFPVISYRDATALSLKLYKCNNVSCSSGTASTLDDPANTVGEYTSLAIGTDGFPVISYRDATALSLKLYKCNNVSCSSGTASTLDDPANDVGRYTSIAIGADGFPVISYYDFTAVTLKLYKCNNVSCSSGTASTIDDPANNVGEYSSLAIGTDGFPVISYRDATALSLKLYKCNNVSCSSGTASTLDDPANDVGSYNTSLAIGQDGFPVISYYDSTAGALKLYKCFSSACATGASSTANLTRTNSDLSRFLDDDGYTNVATANDVYDSLAAGTSTRLAYLFTKKAVDNTSDIGVTWEGQVSLATTTYLKIYNNSSGAWETLASNGSPTANTDFTLTATQTVNVANYYDSSNVVYVRVETGTTTASTTLKTDQVNINIPTATLSQTAYIFLNDNGTTTDTYTQSHSAATSTAITNVKKGEKLITRIQIDNTGGATSTAQYRLQWENNTDAAGTWTDLGTTTQIRWALSEKAAMPGRSGQVPLTAKQVGNCTTTTTFVSGYFVAGTATSSMLSLGPTKCTELAYAIETSGATLNKTYRLRLVTGSTTTALDAYTKYPTFTIESAQSIRYSKEARGIYSTTTLDSAGNVGDYSAIAIGADGFPVIAYSAPGPSDLKFIKCNNLSCSSKTISTLDGVDVVGSETSIAIGSDGFPVIAYYDFTNGDLKFAKCNNISCSSYTASSLDTGGNVGYNTSIAIGADGFPVIAYRDGTAGYLNLNFAKCNNVSCSSYATSSLDTGGDVGQYASIAIGSDGFPVISYQYVTNFNLNFAKCNNISCSSYTTTALDTGGDVGFGTSLAIGSDGFPVISYYALSGGNLNFAKCNNISCSSVATSSLDWGGSVGEYPNLAIGADGFPVIAYRDGSGLNLNFAKCNNVSCTSYATSSLDTGGDIGQFTSIAIGADGFPVISYYDVGNINLNFVKCNDLACSTEATSTRLSYLSTTNSDLSRFLDDDGYTNVGSSNDVYDSLAAGTSTRLAYLFTKKALDNTSDIGVTWEGQVSLATTTYLKIYNNSSSVWETLAQNNSPTANTDFTLTATQTANVANYYDASNVVYVRVETGTTTASTTLKTDQVNINIPIPTLSQTAYIFLNDNGTTTDTYTQSHSAATSTSITNVKKGEKLIARIQIDNTGGATSTAQYRLQWENNTDAAGTWTDLGTTTQIRWALSEKGAMPGRSGQVPLTSKQVGNCTTTTTFVSGLFVAGTATSSMMSLGPTKCTELAYAIETSGATLNKTYRLRLVTGSTTSALDAYTKYPTFTIESAQDIRYSKEARGIYSTTTLDSLATVGLYTSIAIGADGFPVISSQGNNSLIFTKCNNPSCSSYATSSLAAGSNGFYTSIAIGSDGFPVISYYVTSNFRLAKCNNISCSSVTITTLDTGAGDGQYSSVAIGTDGFPVLSYLDNTSSNLNFIKCNNLSCSSAVISTLDAGGTVGNFTSIGIGSDGFPVISYQDASLLNLNFAKCNNISCSSYATSAVDTVGIAGDYGTSLAIGTDGLPVVSYVGNSGLTLMKCNNISCSSYTKSSIGTESGRYSAIAIGTDGFPVISYYRINDGDIRFAKCGNISCTTVSTSTLDAGGDVGFYTSLAIGADGFPVISYQDVTNGNLNFLKCNDSACSTEATSTRLSYLSATTTDLSRYLDDDGYTNVASANDVYDSLTAGTSTRLAYLFTKKHTNNTDTINPTWEGQVSKATTTELKLFNHAAGTWETLASNSAPTANTDFTLTGTQSTNLANYYDASNVVYLRVETGTTTASTTLKTDQMTITLGSVTATLSTQYYRFREDNGTEIAATYTTGENTALGTSSNMYIGDRKRLRFSVANTGGATASGITYRLEHASSSCTSWYAVPAYNAQSGQEWVMDQSQWIPDGAATTHSSGMSVPSGKSFVAGQARLNANQTSAHTLTTSEYTEFEFAFRSTNYVQSNIPYCFRLTNAGSITNFSYVVQPRLVVNPSRRPEYGGGGSEGSGSGAAFSGGGQGGGSGTEGSGSGTPRSGGGQGGGGGDSG